MALFSNESIYVDEDLDDVKLRSRTVDTDVALVENELLEHVDLYDRIECMICYNMDIVVVLDFRHVVAYAVTSGSFE